MLRLAAGAIACAAAVSAQAGVDWLIQPVTTPVTFAQQGTGVWTLSNGLVSRTFATSPGFGTIDYRTAALNQTALRAVGPEAIVQLDNITYFIGDLTDTLDFHGYWNSTAAAQPGALVSNASAWRMVSYTTAAPTATVPWSAGRRGSPANAAWPPAGLNVAFNFAPPASAPPSHQAVVITIVYEMYMGIPLLSKWVLINSTGPAAAGVHINAVQPEVLRAAHPYAQTGWTPGAPYDLPSPPVPSQLSYLYVQTDEAHGTQVAWGDDPWSSQQDYGANEPVLITSYTTGPGVYLSGGTEESAAAFAASRGRTAHWHPRMHATGLGATVAEFVSFRTLSLFTDTQDRERSGLAVRRMMRVLAPWVQENPIFFHATNTTGAGFNATVQQMAATGFEMFIYSFGTAFCMECPEQVANASAQIAYAHSLGIEVGGYDLICLERGAGGYGSTVPVWWNTWAAPNGTLGQDACFASGWVDALQGYINNYLAVNLTMVETDGPYGGEPCYSTNHSYHLDGTDSVYQQNKLQGAFYAQLQASGIYSNQPDSYFFQGGSKAPLGYSEEQYNLPRQQDLTVSRIGMWEDLYTQLPSQGWMFLPIDDYHGGGDAASFEPLAVNSKDYNLALAEYFGYGVAACYRGSRLYDPASPYTQHIVTAWVSWFKTYRDILTSDIVHVRRPDGQGLDAILHVNPQLLHRGMAVVYNPLPTSQTALMTFPLYYTGISTTALVSVNGAPANRMDLARDYSITLPVTVSGLNATWILITSAD